jgi:hypothetical protein
MKIRIPLPAVVREPNSKAHPYPFQIGLQTQHFIQGSLFYAMLADITAGEYVRTPGAIEQLKQKTTSEGLNPNEWERGWQLLEKYKSYFEMWVFQGVLVLMQSHWDWYIRRLGGFVSFGRKHVQCPPLNKKDERALKQIGFVAIRDQIEVLERSCGLQFEISAEAKLLLAEMAEVRNLGMHNRWEVDQRYSAKTQTQEWQIGDMRTFGALELQIWYKVLIEAILKTSVTIAQNFSTVPTYPDDHET